MKYNDVEFNEFDLLIVLGALLSAAHKMQVPWPEDVSNLANSFYDENTRRIPVEDIEAGIDSMVAAITAVDPTWKLDDFLNKLYH